MRWHIGQKVLCIEGHNMINLVKGKIYTINAIRKPACGCKYVEIDVGLDGSRWSLATCSVCDIDTKLIGNMFFHERRFAPLQTEDELSELTVEEILEEYEYIHQNPDLLQ